MKSKYTCEQAMTFSTFTTWCLRKLVIVLLERDYLKYNIFLYHLVNKSYKLPNGPLLTVTVINFL